MQIIVLLSSYIAFLSRTSAAAPNDINPDCFDQDSLCGFWAVTGECDRGILWMTFTCPFSCGLCAADGIQGDMVINPQDGDLASGNFCDNSDFPLNLVANSFHRFAGMPSRRMKQRQTTSNKKCNFYVDYNKEPGLSCGETGYLLGYGDKFCSRFCEAYGDFSPMGRQWLNCVRRNLINALAKFKSANPTASCGQIEDAGFKSHSKIYTDCGYCKVILPNYQNCVTLLDVLGLTPLHGRFAVSNDTLTLRTVDQLIDVTKTCGQQTGRTTFAGQMGGEIAIKLIKYLSKVKDDFFKR